MPTFCFSQGSYIGSCLCPLSLAVSWSTLNLVLLAQLQQWVNNLFHVWHGLELAHFAIRQLPEHRQAAKGSPSCRKQAHFPAAVCARFLEQHSIKNKSEPKHANRSRSSSSVSQFFWVSDPRINFWALQHEATLKAKRDKQVLIFLHSSSLWLPGYCTSC